MPLLTGLLLQAPLAAAQTPPLPTKPSLTTDARIRLAKAAQDAALAPWQREIMQEIARGRATATAAQALRALPGDPLRSAGSTADDGSWLAIPPPTGRYGCTAIYDPVRERMVTFGGVTMGENGLNDAWLLPLSGSPAWGMLTPTGTPPSAGGGHTAIYDPVRDRMVVFRGGASQVWALSLSGSPAWSAFTPAGTPPPGGSSGTAIYDPVRDRMVVFGGSTAAGNNVWALALSGSPAWSQLAPAGSPPSGRFLHTAIYDPVRDRVVVFGGTNDGYNGRSDVWALSLSGSPTWNQLAPAGTLPPARLGHSAIYDPVRDRMVVFGGFDGSNNQRNDVWALSLAGSPAWTEIAPAGTLPSARFWHAAIYDPVHDRMVVFAGDDGNAPYYRNDAWGLSLAGIPAWSEIAPATQPSASLFHTAIYDAPRDRMLVFREWNEVWALSLAGSPVWSELAPAGTPPPGRAGHAAIYDPARDRMVVFGGRDEGYNFRNDAWALSLAGSPAWSQLTPAGSPPSGRYLHTAIYDPIRDRMVVFGGAGDANILRNDVWALSLAGSPAWSQLAPGGTLPSARYWHSAIYDPVRDRMVVYGGEDDSEDRFPNDVWTLSLAGNPTWSELAPAGTLPRVRYWHTAIYDPARDRMVVFGGLDDGYNELKDVWALSLAGSQAWSQLAPGGTPPSARYGHTTIYDPLRDRMVVFAGEDDSEYMRNDAWALTWGAGSQVETAFDLRPNTLNLTSQGLWVTGYLEPASPFAAGAIDIGSIRLNGTVAVDPAAPTALGDHNGNGIPDLMVKFNRAALELTLSEGDHVPVNTTGTVNGHSFCGTDYVRVRRAVVSAPAAGSHLTADSMTQIRWQTPSGITVESVALLKSLDGGSTWSMIAQGQPNSGSYDWTVPSAAAEHAKVAVVLVESANGTGDVVEGVLGVSQAFAIDNVVGLGDRGPARLAMRGATPNPAVGGRLNVEFALRDGSPASLELMDVAGRVLASKQVGTLGHGTHTLDLSEGGALRPGIYFFRLTQGGSEVRARAAVIR